MRTTKLIIEGKSQYILIPEDLAFADSTKLLEIERIGEEVRIRPFKKSLSGVLKKFASFSPDFMSEAREDQEQIERIERQFK